MQKVYDTYMCVHVNSSILAPRQSLPIHFLAPQQDVSKLDAFIRRGGVDVDVSGAGGADVDTGAGAEAAAAADAAQGGTLGGGGAGAPGGAGGRRRVRRYLSAAAAAAAEAPPPAPSVATPAAAAAGLAGSRSRLQLQSAATSGQQVCLCVCVRSEFIVGDGVCMRWEDGRYFIPVPTRPRPLIGTHASPLFPLGLSPLATHTHAQDSSAHPRSASSQPTAAAAAASSAPQLRFDADTAVRVLRGAGYAEHALLVADAAGQVRACACVRVCVRVCVWGVWVWVCGWMGVWKSGRGWVGGRVVGCS